LKQKCNNIKNLKIYFFKKGLIFLILLLFVGNIYAQKIYTSSIITSSTKIMVDFNIIDQIETVITDDIDKIDVIAKNEEMEFPNFILEDKNGIVFIKEIENSLEDKNLQIDKLCMVQPVYTSYQIKIPKGRNVYVSYAQGNFYANNFEGNLYLSLDKGIVKINSFKGCINIKINVGNVYCNQINNSKIDIKSNLGNVFSDFHLEDAIENINQIKGIFGKDMNELNIQAIQANIQLKSFKNI
jgi:hypothetical protein